jgi:ribosomal protein L37AE/L43A
MKRALRTGPRSLRDAAQGFVVEYTRKGAQMEDATYELKYCERCGSLGLRRSKSGESYCRPCGQVLVSYSLPGDTERKLLLRKSEPESLTPLAHNQTVAPRLSGGRPQ